MHELRPFQENDYGDIVRIRNTVMPNPITVDQLKSWDAANVANPEVIFKRWCFEADGRVAGYCIAERHPDALPGSWFIDVGVDPDWQRQGLGAQLLAAAEGFARDGGATTLEAFVRGDSERSVAWVKGKGYQVDRTRTESVLDLTEFDRQRFAGQVDRVSAGGLELRSYLDKLSDDLLRRVYDWDVTTTPDVPIFEGNLPTFDDWARHFNEDPTPHYHAYAFDGEKVVAGSIIYFPPAAGATEAYTGYTAVRREYRGRGLALAVKLMTIDEALRRGFRSMRTNNDPDNPPMLAVNEKLGYVLVPGPMRVKKPVG